MFDSPRKPLARRSLFSLALDVATGHAWKAVGNALSVVEEVETSVKISVMKFVREMIIIAVLLFAGIGFMVFGIGMAIVQALGMGPVLGSILVGALFAVLGVVVFVFVRRR
ncbi:MAG: hypothetical protein IPL87_05020 [Candidatus Moraniibacteriota bacterium]|nr:MAG: hypothetical protein IPL87_05020 [Candidatus Moranbacteria bacterium]